MAAAAARTQGGCPASRQSDSSQQPGLAPAPRPLPPLPASLTLAVLLQRIQVWAHQRVQVPHVAILKGPRLHPEQQQQQSRRRQQQMATCHDVISRDSSRKQPDQPAPARGNQPAGPLPIAGSRPDGRQAGTKAATLVDSSAYDARVELSRHGIVWRAVSAEPPAMPLLTSSSSSRCLSQSATGCPGEQASNALMTPARRRKAYGARSPPVGIGIAAWCSRHAGLLPRRITSTSMRCWSGVQHRQEARCGPAGWRTQPCSRPAPRTPLQQVQQWDIH